MSPRASIVGLVVWIVLSLGAGALGALFPPGGWYVGLRKPAFTPPGWVFGPVWTLLYILMGTAAWLVWKPSGFRAAWLALSLFLFQLILNGAWTWMFFGLRRPDLALVDIAVLWTVIGLTTFAFWGRSHVAATLLVPYFFWVTFAAVLNYYFWRLNR